MKQNKCYTYLLLYLWVSVMCSPIKAAVHTDATPKAPLQVAASPCRQPLAYSAMVNRLVYGWVRSQNNSSFLVDEIILLIISFYPPKIILFTGPPNAGKRTAISALQGDTIRSKRDQGTRKITYIPGAPNLKIPSISPETVLKRKKTMVYTDLVSPKKIAFRYKKGTLEEAIVSEFAEFSPPASARLRRTPSDIDGIVWVVSAHDILQLQGYVFQKSAKSLQSEYFEFLKNSTLKQSLLLMITKYERNQDEIQQRICHIIQKSYQDYFKALKRLQDLIEDNDTYYDFQVAKKYSGIKFFWKILLAEEVGEEAIDDIHHFRLDRARIGFFDPSNPANVQATLAQLERLPLLTGLAST